MPCAITAAHVPTQLPRLAHCGSQHLLYLPPLAFRRSSSTQSHRGHGRQAHPYVAALRSMRTKTQHNLAVHNGKCKQDISQMCFTSKLYTHPLRTLRQVSALCRPQHNMPVQLTPTPNRRHADGGSDRPGQSLGPANAASSKPDAPLQEAALVSPRPLNGSQQEQGGQRAQPTARHWAAHCCSSTYTAGGSSEPSTSMEKR